VFGIGGSEIIVILVVALLFLGPDKLPDAAKTISKGIRDIKKQSRALQRTIEDDEHIGGAIRDLRSALRGEDEPIRPKPAPPKQIEEAPTPDPVPPAITEVAAAAVAPDPGTADATGAAGEASTAPHASDTSFEGGHSTPATPTEAAPNSAHDTAARADAADAPKLTLPPTAGEPAPDQPASTAHQDAELAQLVKPAPNTIARGAVPVAAGSSEPSEPKHG